MKKHLSLILILLFSYSFTFGQVINKVESNNIQFSKSIIINNADLETQPILKLQDSSEIQKNTRDEITTSRSSEKNIAISKKNTEKQSFQFEIPETLKGKKEILEKRDLTSKHFQNEDGSLTAILAAGPLHYKRNGKYEDINHLIVPSNEAQYAFVNTTNLLHTYFGTNSFEGVKNRTHENATEIQEFLNVKMFWQASGQNLLLKNATNVALTVNGDKAYYKNVLGNIDAEFTIESGKRKLNYIIPNAQALSTIPANADYLVFSEDIILPQDWTYAIDAEKGILIKDTNGEAIYAYENPVSTDANPSLDRNKNTVMEASLSGNTLTILTKVKTAWLLDTNRQFPIKVDPTVNVTPNNTTNWTRSVYSDGDAQTGLYFGRVSGYFLAGFAKFNTSAIPTSGVSVSSAIGYINVTGVWGAWNGNWQFANSSDPTTTSGLSLYSSVNLGLSGIGSFNSGGWKNSTFINPGGNTYLQNGIALGSINLSIYPVNSYSPTVYYQLDDHTSTNKPYLSITYTVTATPPSCANTPNPANTQTNVTPTGSISWAAAAGATSYDIYFGTSPSPSYVTNVSTNSYTPTMLANTTYYWRVVPKNSYGSATGCSTLSFTTGLMPQSGDYRTRFQNASIYAWSSNVTNWEIFNGSNWVVASVLPSATNNVLIREGSHYVVLNSPNNSSGASCKSKNLTVEGKLQFWNGLDPNTSAYGDLDIYGDLSISTSGTLETFTNVTGIEAISSLNMVNGGNVDVYGKLSLYNETNYNSYSNAWIVFYGNNTSNLTLHPGSDTRFFYLQFAKTNATDTVNININENFYAVNNQNSGNNGFIRTYNQNSWDVTPKGYVRIQGTYAKDNPIWFMGLSTYSFSFNSSSGVAQDLKVEINHSGFGVQAQNNVFNLAGELIVNQGQVDIGATSGTISGTPISQYYLNILNGGTLTVNGGSLNTRAGIAGNGTHSFTQTGGVINVGRNANDSPRGLFDLIGNPQVTISGGLITLTDNRFTNNNLGYRVVNGNINITGGKLQIGSSNSPAGSNTFSIQGHAPSIDLYTNNSNIISNAIMWDDVLCYGNLDIPVNCGFSLYNQDSGDTPHTLEIKGNINHEGDLYGEIENSKILFNGISNQVFNSIGTYSQSAGIAGVSIIEVDNPADVNLTGLGTTVIKNFIKKNGTFNIDNTKLKLYGVVNRTNGFLGGNQNSNLEIYGNGSTGNLYFNQSQNNLSKLLIDKNNNTDNVFITNNVKIYNEVNLEKGLLYTYENGDESNPNSTIELQENAFLINESLDSYIIGVASISKDVSSSSEIGNLGVEFLNLPNSLGNVSIERTTGINAEQSINGQSSIHSYWEVDVQNQPLNDMETHFKWLSVFDNSYDLNDLRVWKKDSASIWSEQVTNIINTNAKRVFSSEVSSFSGWTLSASRILLPVSWLNIYTSCLEQGVQLNWSTATEINNDYFEVFASNNGIDFESLGRLNGAGNSTAINTYSFHIENKNKYKYFKVKQADFDGQFEFSKIATANCSNHSSNLEIYPNPIKDNVFYINYTEEINDLTIKVYDLSGKLIDTPLTNKTANNIQVTLSKQLAEGVYLVEIYNQQGFIAMKKIMTK